MFGKLRVKFCECLKHSTQANFAACSGDAVSILIDGAPSFCEDAACILAGMADTGLLVTSHVVKVATSAEE